MPCLQYGIEFTVFGCCKNVVAKIYWKCYNVTMEIIGVTNETKFNDANYKNAKVTISLVPFSNDVNSFRLFCNVNREYNLVDYGDYFVPYYHANGCLGAKTIMVETHMERWRTCEERIKNEWRNHFISKTYIDENGRSMPEFYGYFDSLRRANREYNMKLKPYLLEKLIPYERISDKKLVETIRNLRFS